jgi:hypothetical protein
MSAESAIKLLRREYDAAVAGRRSVPKDFIRRVLWNADVDDGLRRAVEDLSDWYLQKNAHMPVVRGKCPSCGSYSLFLAQGGYITCAKLDCKDPCSAGDVLHADQRPLVDRDV